MAATMDSLMPSMPGAYHFQYDGSRGASTSRDIYQLPVQSSTPSQRYSQIPRPISRSSTHSASRKRPRLDTNNSYFSRPTRPSHASRSSTTLSTPFSLDGSYDHVTPGHLDASVSSFGDPNLMSPSPLANSEYRLAGGLDTPNASFEQNLDEIAQDEAEKDYRFNRYSTNNTSRTAFSTSGSRQFSSGSHSANLGTISQNGRKRGRTAASSTRYPGSLTGWGIRSTAWALTGGLAGKVFNFCLNTAFGGFRAGGGETYNVDLSSSAMSGVYSNGGVDGPSIPSAFSQDLGGFVEDYINSPQSRRPKQQHAPVESYSGWNSNGLDNSAIKNDWQIIDQVNFADSGDEQSPVRKRSRASVAGSWQRPSSRNSMNGRSCTTNGASYASPRPRSSVSTAPQQRTSSNGGFQPVKRSRPSLAQPRRSYTQQRASTNLYAGQPSPERPSSSASMRQYQKDNSSASGLSPEALNYRRKMKQQERVADENLRRLNAQLRDMIREGKEALGSKVEICDEYSTGHGMRNDFDEGFYDDGWK